MRILHILGSADYGGIPSVVFNYMRFIDREKYHFDLALNNEPGELGHRMSEMGAAIYRLPLRSHGLKEYEACLHELLKREHFDAIHVHSGTTSYVDLRIAKKVGIRCRIAHSHSKPICTTAKQNLRKYSGWVFNGIYATKMIGCGIESGEEIFGRHNMSSTKGLVLPNAIDIEQFRFSSESRASVRKELEVDEDTYVIGMVAAFSPRKNHFFAIRVLEELCKYSEDIENFAKKLH